ncbi:hypothetical protein [Streptomyces silvensis]|uniref:Endonuclease n=1 Tax=Streptomyces silvensis TaxID=1765722 RepID=A0A0W7X7P6_9ACTN|nr:hypothetical protein [Streptomyces silvensis]KUF18811.1 hypothetical protein AT728_07180 [Streptomyces silvensis]
MPHSTPRAYTVGAASVALAVTAALAATAPTATAAVPAKPAAEATPSLKVLTYNAFLFSKIAQL